MTGGQDAFVANGNESQTMAAVLDAAGYQTVMIGKYLNGYSSDQPVSVASPCAGIRAGCEPQRLTDGAIIVRTQH